MSADRAAAILTRFSATSQTFASKLRGLPPGLAESRADAASWTPAQIGCHVALSNDWIAGVLTGSTAAERMPAGAAGTFDPARLPPTDETFPAMVPPTAVSREVALERFRASVQRVSRAIAALNAERGTGHGVALEFGTLSLYELADYAATHITRHLAQVDRVVGRTKA
jgi:hypothetical protein